MYKHYSTSNQSYGSFSQNSTIVQEYSDAISSASYNSEIVYNYQGSPPGLPNIGNTCYINSALQCLFHIPQISNFFLSDHFAYHLKKEKKQAKIARNFMTLIKSFKEFNINIKDLYEFKESFEALNENLLGHEQQDSQEFLRIFLDNLHEAFNEKSMNYLNKKPQDFNNGMNEHILANDWWDFNKTRDQSPITNIFLGQYISTLNCKDCGNVSKCFENFMDISLSFKTNENKYTIDWESKATVDLIKLFDEFMKIEGLVSKCDKCKKTSQKNKGLKFSRLPDVLCIHLKRFEYCDGMRKKIKNPVCFQKERLDLTRYFNNPTLRESCYFNLIGVIEHYGEVNFGHYIAECKNGKRWYNYDDSKVGESEINFGEKDVRSSSAYILFCEKVRR